MTKLADIINKQQEIELFTSIDGRAEIPVKYIYFGKGAENWDRVYKAGSLSKDSIVSEQGRLLHSRINEILNVALKADKMNLIDIGCGNGMPAIPILEELMARGITIRYVPIDISRKMIELATANVKGKIKGIEVKSIELDFERGNFSDFIYDLKSSGYSNFMLFLGNTLGNQQDTHRVLSNFRDSMSSSDFLLIGNQLTNVIRVEKILGHYAYSELGEIVYNLPKLIGIDEKNTLYKESWNEKMSRVEIRLVLKKEARVNIGKESLSMEKGEMLLVLISKKFTELSFSQLISEVGFRTALSMTSEDGSYILSLIQPVRHTSTG